MQTSEFSIDEIIIKLHLKSIRDFHAIKPVEFFSLINHLVSEHVQSTFSFYLVSDLVIIVVLIIVIMIRTKKKERKRRRKHVWKTD